MLLPVDFAAPTSEIFFVLLPVSIWRRVRHPWKINQTDFLFLAAAKHNNVQGWPKLPVKFGILWRWRG